MKTKEQIKSMLYNTRTKFVSKYIRHGKGITHNYHLFYNEILYYNNLKHELMSLFKDGEKTNILNLGTYKDISDIAEKIFKNNQKKLNNYVRDI